MSDGIKRFPPEFDSTKKYPRQYDLEQIDVYVEASPGEYFNINGLPENIGFGKHAFTIFVTDAEGGAPLKNFSNVLFEAKDSAGNLIYSGVSNKQDLSGASVCFIWIKEDPITTTNDIQQGIGSLTLVGQLQDVPTQYQNVYNVRTTFPLNIRTDFLNTSPILFQSSSKIASDLTITETLEADIDNPNFNKSYANITIKNLETFGGEVETIQVSYLESGSLSVLQDEEFTLLTQQRVNKVSGSFEDDIDFRISRGLNPISQSLRVVMPPMANQSGSNFGLGDNKFKFKFEFLNKNNEKAKDFDSGEDLNITSSFVDFVGPATVITGENNLIAGQMYVGNSVGQGLEVSAENSAFLRSIGYLGFTSASAGSGSGFMLYSGSVLAANTDDYQQGGVGFEFVSSSEAFMRFNTNPGIFDVRAKSFFVGSETTQFISGSGTNIEISASGFHLTPEGNVTMSGQLAVEAGGTLGGFTIGEDALFTSNFRLSSSVNNNDPVSFISSSKFKVSAGGVLTASAAFIEGAIITGSTSIDVGNDIKVKGVKVAALNINNEITLGGDTAQLTASSAIINDLTYSDMSGSFISASGIRLDGNMVVDGTVTANTFVTNTIQENFSTGNTIFGNSNDDIHAFTGSVVIQHTGSSNTGLLLSGSDLKVVGDISASGILITGLGISMPDSKGIAFTDTGIGDMQLVGASNKLAIYSGSFPKIIFDVSQSATPKIGIGTTAPTKALQVTGDISASGDIFLGHNKFLRNNVGDTALLGEFGNIVYIGSINHKTLFQGDTTNGIQFGQNTSIPLVMKGHITASGDISASGNLIATGDLNIDGKSHFEGNITASGNISSSGNIYASKYYLHPTKDTFIGSLDDGDDVNIESVDDIRLRPTDDISIHHGTTEYVRFDGGNQRVGIGTDSPSEKLHIDGNVRTNTTQGYYGSFVQAISNAGLKLGNDDYSGFMFFKDDGKIGIGTESPSEKLDVDGNIKTTGNISSPSFQSGFAGSGFRITSGSDGKTSFAVDDLTVRGQMNVFEMLIHQVRATNGSLFVSNTGRIISASLENASTKQYKLFFDTGSGYGHSFRVGDVIRAQRFTPAVSGDNDGVTDGPASYKSDLTIESVTGISESIARLTGSNGTTDAPTAGYEYVRIGSISDTDRQGSIYLTADDDDAPFIDVADGIKTHAGFNTTGTVKTRMGKLTGITSAKFGTLSGYGFYSSGSSFLEGAINADKGSVGGWSLSNSIISSSNITLDSVNEKITIENTTFGAAGVQLENDSGGKLYAGDGSNKFLQFDGTNALIKASNFELDSSGNITASNALLSGKLTSTEGAIGGFTINEKSLSSTNFTLSASTATNELFISHSSFKVKNSGQVTASALLLTGSANTNFLQFTNGVLTIRGDVAASSLSTTNFNVNSAGQITASAGTIGGFTISSTSLTSGSKIVLDASQSLFSINDRTFGNDGIQLDFNGGSPRAFIGNKTGSHFNFDGTNVFISSSKFLLGSGEQFISGSGGKLQIRAQDVVLSGSSVRVQTDDFFLGGQGSFISGANDQIEITSSQFHLDRDGNATFGGDIKVGSQPSQTNLNDGLILHYNFDQYSSEQQPGARFPLRNNVEEFRDMTADISIGNGSIEASSGSNAIVNTGLFFSGSDRTKTITLDHDTINSDMIDTNNYSLSFFFKPVNVAREGDPPQQIFGAGGSSNGFNAFITASKIITNFYETDKGSVTSASIANNTMYHLVTTYEGGEAKLYLNSELIQTDNISVGTITGFSGKIFLGGFTSNQEYYLTSGSAPINFSGTQQPYEGYLDEVRLYKGKVLTQNEVRAIFLNPQANVSNVVNGGQIEAGIIKSLNSSATAGTILNLQAGELHAGGSGSSARFLFDGTQLRVSASNFFVGSESFISGSGTNIEISSSGFHLKPEGDAIFSGSITANDGTIGGFTLGTTKLTTTGFEIGNSSTDFALSSSKFQVTHDGQLTGSQVLVDGGKIGGFDITSNQLSIDNIKLSSLEKGLVISSSDGQGKVLISSGSLSSTVGSTTNYFVTPSFEGLSTDLVITGSHGGTSVGAWHIKNDTATGSRNEELWNSGSVSMSLSDTSGQAGDGSIHLRINVKRELGPPGSGLTDGFDPE